MTTFVRRDGYLTEVRVASHVDGILADGVRRLQPSDVLFGRAARLVPEGVYDDAGNFLGTHDDYDFAAQ